MNPTLGSPGWRSSCDPGSAGASRCRGRQGAALLVAGVWLAVPTLAQAADFLPALGGQNAAQVDMNDAILTMCPELDMRVDEPGRTDEETQLNITCANLVFNDGEQPAGDDGDRDGDGDDDILGLELSDGQQRAALQSINGEELMTPQLRVGEIQDVQTSAIRSRLLAIRAGLTAPGISLTNLDIDIGDRVLALEDLADLEVLPAQAPNEGFLSRLGVFVTGTVTFGDKDGTGAADGFDFHSEGVTVGADYRLNEQLVLGGAIGYARFDADFDETDTSPDGQELDSDGVLFSLFGSYFPIDQLFFDAIASFGWNFYDAERRIEVDNENPALDLGAGPGEGIDTDATGDFDAFHFGIAGNAGYDLDLAGARVTPLVRFEFLHAEIDGYTEESDSVLNLKFDDQDASSFTTNLGLEAAYPISTRIGVVSPFARAEYVHEFLDDEDGVAIQYANDPTGTSRFEITTESIDQDYGIVGAGVAATFAHGWAGFVDWNTVVGLSHFDIHTVNVGLRKAF